MITAGNAGIYVGGRAARPVPTDASYRPHRPWCVDCKTKHDAADLDVDDRCARCAAARVVRAAAAARRATVEAAERAAAKVAGQELPTEGNQGQPTTRRSAPRTKSTSSSTCRARDAGSSTTEENPPPTRETRPRVAGGPTGPRSTIDTATIRQMYVTDLRSIPDIARTLGHTPATVRRALTAAHVPLRDDRKTRSGGHPLVRDSVTITAIVDRYTSGQTIAQIGDELRVGRRQITRILGDAGVAVRPPAHKAHLKPDEAARRSMVDQYLAGATLLQIGARHHIRSALVAEIIRAQGHEIRPKGGSASIKARIADIGATSAEVRAWALEQGLVTAAASGLLAAAVIDRYTAAHASQEAS